MAVGDRKKKRIRLIALGAVAMTTATVLAAFAFNDSIIYFYGPERLLEKAASGEIEPTRKLRLGGLVAMGSVAHAPEGGIRFVVEDAVAKVPVAFEGVPPDLFREGQGVVAIGVYREGAFVAEEILAKHDEKYIPAEVAAELKRQGQWKPDDADSGGS